MWLSKDREKNPKNMKWNEVVKAAVERKGTALKKALKARDEVGSKS